MSIFMIVDMEYAHDGFILRVLSGSKFTNYDKIRTYRKLYIPTADYKVNSLIGD